MFQSPASPPGPGSSPDSTPPPAPGLAAALRERTAASHARAERGGLVAAILSGTVTPLGYALYLRNLLPAYRAMEDALWCHRALPGMRYMSQTSLRRAARMEADLGLLRGPNWPLALPLLSTGRRYAECVRRAGDARPELLYAHAYTRYLGDLYGGQILRRHLVRRFGADFRATAFTEFPEIEDIRRFAAGFRAALDEAGRHLADSGPVLEEAAAAFELNIVLSEETAALQFS